MPDLLREQFPFFRPIVEAFGYPQPRVRGLGSRRRDRHARHPGGRGRDPDMCRLDRPRCLPARHRQRLPDDDPARRGGCERLRPNASRRGWGSRPTGARLHRLKGDPSDNIAGVPGIGDKTASQLIAAYGSLEGVLEHVDELTPARRKAIAEHADQARNSRELATMRRDLDIDCDPAELVLAPPDRSQLAEMFRRFEFRALLQRVDQLDEALPAAAPRVVEGEALPWREADDASNTVLQGSTVGIGVDERRVAIATDEGVVVGPKPSNTVLQGFRPWPTQAQRVVPADDTLLAAYLIEPGRARTTRRPRARVRGRRPPRARGRRGDDRPPPQRARCRPARVAMRAPARARESRAVRTIELPTSVLAEMEDAGVRIVPTDGRDHRPARRPRRGAGVEGVRARRRGVHARLDPAGRPHPLRSSSSPRQEGRPGTRPTRVLRTIRGEHEIVGVIEE